MSQKILLAQQGFSLAYLIKPMSPCLHHMAYIIIKNYLLSKAFNDRPYKVHEPKFLLVHQASNNRPFNECEPKIGLLTKLIALLTSPLLTSSSLPHQDCQGCGPGFQVCLPYTELEGFSPGIEGCSADSRTSEQQ
ncbi:hypothetical protein TIFTF001_037019 [Ficus carica]|uniref:Uncharacterized protein n=1 Tax=Ficus carica TaxID=3494 RepID=A0AA88E7Z0_FICCA|nr:hypothetical protein TIFTF001_037019 [Ficus carica]